MDGGAAWEDPAHCGELGSVHASVLVLLADCSQKRQCVAWWGQLHHPATMTESHAGGMTAQLDITALVNSQS